MPFVNLSIVILSQIQLHSHLPDECSTAQLCKRP